MGKAKPKKAVPTKPTKPTPTSKKASSTPSDSSRPPKLEWVKNPDWTWSLIAYLTNHVAFRIKLFSDSTADASKEGRSKAVAKDGKAQQYATLAEGIFKDDKEQGLAYLQDKGRFATSVETRLRRLKKDYIEHLKTLGKTGAGLAPEDVTPGSSIANLVDDIKANWPWWEEFHRFWHKLPNYNTIGVHFDRSWILLAIVEALSFTRKSDGRWSGYHFGREDVRGGKKEGSYLDVVYEWEYSGVHQLVTT